jgi:hypothetical protein
VHRAAYSWFNGAVSPQLRTLAVCLRYDVIQGMAGASVGRVVAKQDILDLCGSMVYTAQSRSGSRCGSSVSSTDPPCSASKTRTRWTNQSSHWEIIWPTIPLLRARTCISTAGAQLVSLSPQRGIRWPTQLDLGH